MPPKKPRAEPKAHPDVKHAKLPPEPDKNYSTHVRFAALLLVFMALGGAAAWFTDLTLRSYNSILRDIVADARQQVEDKKAELAEVNAKLGGETKRADEEEERRRTAERERDDARRDFAAATVDAEELRKCKLHDQAFNRQDRELTRLSNTVSQDAVAFGIFQNSLNFQSNMLKRCEGGEQ